MAFWLKFAKILEKSWQRIFLKCMLRISIENSLDIICSRLNIGSLKIEMIKYCGAKDIKMRHKKMHLVFDVYF